MYLDTMFPDELDRYIEENENRTAVIPIGSVEQHGVHLLLGTDGFTAYAMAAKAAEILGGVLLPMVPYSWIGGLRPFAGTFDMRPFITAEYMEQIGLNVFNLGFDKLVFVNTHGGGREMVYSVARRIFKKVGKPVVTMYPSNFHFAWPEHGEIWAEHGVEHNWTVYEASKLVGALQRLGEHAIAEKVLTNLKNALEEFSGGVTIPEQPGLRSAFTLGEIGHDYNHECQHAPPQPVLCPEAGSKATDFMAAKLAWVAQNA